MMVMDEMTEGIDDQDRLGTGSRLASLNWILESISSTVAVPG